MKEEEGYTTGGDSHAGAVTEVNDAENILMQGSFDKSTILFDGIAWQPSIWNGGCIHFFSRNGEEAVGTSLIVLNKYSRHER